MKTNDPIKQTKIMLRNVAKRELQRKATTTPHFQIEFEKKFYSLNERAHWHLLALKH